MSTVYISSHNGSLKRAGDVLLYSDYTGQSTKLIPSITDSIIAIGQMNISGAALNLCIDQRIPIFFLRPNGNFNGKLAFEDGKNTLLRHQQHLIAEDKERVSLIAKSIVEGKTLNEYLFMQRILRKNPRNTNVKDCVLKVQERRKKLQAITNDIDVIRGFEGIISRLYFQCLKSNITCAWTHFHKRTKNPPRDEINATLSFLYTLLASKVDTCIEHEGLDSSVGSLHDFSYGRKSLVYDLMEEFRTPIVDTTTCAMFNQGTLTENDFRRETSPKNGQFVLLNGDGVKKAISAFERKLEQSHEYLNTGKAMSYHEIIRHQVRQYKTILQDDSVLYQPQIVT